MKIRLSGKIANAQLVRENFYTVWVQLFDGHIINRHKKKHIISFEDEQYQPAGIKVIKSGFWHRLVNFIKQLFKRRR